MKTKDQRDELIAHKRALGSIEHELENDAERVRQKAEELREAIKRLNGRYVSACERRQAIIGAGGEDPGPPASPIVRVGVIELPLLAEHPPRKRMNLRRTPEQLKREEERRKREQAEFEKAARSVPNLGGMPPTVPLGQI
ncbi:MAG: hypothetical protein ACYSVY_01075 [Planctomycetota bacterium]